MSRTCPKGFSLLELIVAVGVVGILLGLLIPAVMAARNSAAKISCLNNQKQIGLALIGFHDGNGCFPPALPSFQGHEFKLGWLGLLLPYLDEENLFNDTVFAFFANPDPLACPPHQGLKITKAIFICPADGRLGNIQTNGFGVSAAFTSYVGNGGGVNPDQALGFSGIFGQTPGCRLGQISDGSSNTILVGERPPPGRYQAGWWYPGMWFWSSRGSGPNQFLVVGSLSFPSSDNCLVRSAFGPGRLENECDKYHFWSVHSGGANFLFGDGSVRFIGHGIGQNFFYLLSRDGGEVVDIDY